MVIPRYMYGAFIVFIILVASTSVALNLTSIPSPSRERIPCGVRENREVAIFVDSSREGNILTTLKSCIGWIE